MPLQRSDMPAPDTLIDYGLGMVGAAMFHYAHEDQDLALIAAENGFAIRLLGMDEDANGADDICVRWQPRTPDGWKLAGKWDTDEGPVAIFIAPA